MLYNPIDYITLLLGLEVLKALALILYNIVLFLTLDHVTRLTVIGSALIITPFLSLSIIIIIFI